MTFVRNNSFISQKLEHFLCIYTERTKEKQKDKRKKNSKILLNLLPITLLELAKDSDLFLFQWQLHAKWSVL
ncbi:CLUMA_CG019371, isoform A [Clunio marinus]|uniref:CLUMA_CG019371, isoform A n=1 Tax=Clunio marinus TaxID=568069 RepID=A0A1J1J296_9DIPT|nr:CLUMA_CG019371, isoform A [Clunio marinus]